MSALQWREKMAKQPTKSGSSATEALETIITTAIPFRTEQAPSLDLLARLAAQGARLLKLNAEETATVQNGAVLGLMRKFKLLAD
jgi:hypothetical protein